MKVAVVVFSFEEPEDPMIFAEMIEKAKELFKDDPKVKVHAAIKDPASKILDILGVIPEE